MASYRSFPTHAPISVLTLAEIAKGIILPTIDGLLAATAIVHSICIVTHSTRHFEASGDVLLGPWQE